MLLSSDFIHLSKFPSLRVLTSVSDLLVPGNGGSLDKWLKVKTIKFDLFAFPVFGVFKLQLNLSDVGLFNTLLKKKIHKQKNKTGHFSSSSSSCVLTFCCPKTSGFKARMEMKVGSSGGGTYSCAASGCECEAHVINALSLSPAQAWGGVRRLVWSGWFQLWADQFWPGCSELVPAVCWF